MKSQIDEWGRKYLVGRRVSPQAHQHMQDSLLEEAELDIDYVVLTLGACLIATLGLLSNSTAVIIGAMLIAPLMLPIRSVAFGILEEAYIAKRMNQPFRFVFQVSEVKQVTRESVQPSSHMEDIPLPTSENIP
ncbi:MAG: hypothetical protein WBD47_08920 [Phormidesmis sp.]